MDDRIGQALKKVQAVLRAELDAVLEGHGLTTPQHAALLAIARAPGSSNAELARSCFVTPQTMIRIVENLAALGLLTRARHQSHGRVLRNELSAKGRKLLESCEHEVHAVERRLVRLLSASERKQLLELLTRCADGLALGSG